MERLQKGSSWAHFPVSAGKFDSGNASIATAIATTVPMRNVPVGDIAGQRSAMVPTCGPLASIAVRDYVQLLR